MSQTKDSMLINLDKEMTERKTDDNKIHTKISNESVHRAENDAICRIKIAEESAKRSEQHSKLSIRLSESEVKESGENSKLHLKILELEDKINKMSFGKMEPKREEPTKLEEAVEKEMLEIPTFDIDDIDDINEKNFDEKKWIADSDNCSIFKYTLGNEVVFKIKKFQDNDSLGTFAVKDYKNQSKAKKPVCEAITDISKCNDRFDFNPCK